MANLQLNDQIFEAAERRATAEGYPSVSDYVADLVSHDLATDSGEETPNLDHLFTPELLAQVDEAEAEIEAGNYFTAEQVREHFRQKRAAWLQKNGPR